MYFKEFKCGFIYYMKNDNFSVIRLISELLVELVSDNKMNIVIYKKLICGG